MSIDHDGAQIAALMRKHHIRLLELGWDDGGATIGIDAPFNLAMDAAQRALADRGKLVKNVVETTKEDIRRLTGLAAELGWSGDELAQEISKLGEIASITRAELIARTEAAAMYSKGSLIAYAESGQVSGTEWLLGPSPCPECQPLGGKVAALGDAFDGDVEHPPLHPRCTCAIAPVLKD